MIVEEGDWGVGVDLSQYTDDGDEADEQDADENKATPMFPLRQETDRGGKMNMTSVTQRDGLKTPHGYDDDKIYLNDMGTGEEDAINVTTSSSSKGFRCISALLKLSMSKESHEEIIEPENIKIILIYIEKLSFYIKKVPQVWNAPALPEHPQAAGKSFFAERTMFENTAAEEEFKIFKPSKF